MFQRWIERKKQIWYLLGECIYHRQQEGGLRKKLACEEILLLPLRLMALRRAWEWPWLGHEGVVNSGKDTEKEHLFSLNRLSRALYETHAETCGTVPQQPDGKLVERVEKRCLHLKICIFDGGMEIWWAQASWCDVFVSESRHICRMVFYITCRLILS